MDRINTDALPGRTVFIDGECFLYFSGTSYLGIPHNIEFREHLIEGMSIYGTNYSSSRISNLQLPLYDKAEQYLAELIGAEAAVTFSSGFLAGKLLIDYLKDCYSIIYAPFTHPALIQKYSDIHTMDYSLWIKETLSKIGEGDQNYLIICNSIDPLYLRPISFEWLKELPENKKITVVIDESHSLGIVGEDGKGIFETIEKPKNIDFIVISSLGKALGIPGGMVAGSNSLVEKLKKTPSFGGSSPIIPAYIYAFLRSEGIYNNARNALRNSIDHFRYKIEEKGLFNSISSFPVFHTKENLLSKYLFNQKIIISSFSYPTPQDQLITRIILNAMHTKDDINYLINKISIYCSSNI